MRSDRRRLLRALTLGGAVTVAKLPASWSKPVVESVMLPAHARTTPGETCVIQVDVLLALTGNYTGVWSFLLYDLSTCYFAEPGEEDPTNETFSFPQLGPGTYYFDGIGSVNGSEGAGQFRLAVSCCNESAVASVEVTGTGADADGMELEITIGEDGTCLIDIPEIIPGAPCIG